MQVFGQSERGTKLWAGVVNGSGLATDVATETFDNNSFKDVYVRLGQEISEHFIGGFAYYGRARGSTAATGPFSDSFMRVGGDASVSLQKLILFGTVLFARDGNPLATGGRRTFAGGFAEGDVFLTDRTVLTARFDAVHQKLPALFMSGGDETTEEVAVEDEAPFRVNTLAFTPGIQHLVRPNVKLGFEYQVRQARIEDRAIAQLHFSF